MKSNKQNLKKVLLLKPLTYFIYYFIYLLRLLKQEISNQDILSFSYSFMYFFVEFVKWLYVFQYPFFLWNQKQLFTRRPFSQRSWGGQGDRAGGVNQDLGGILN